MRFVYRLTGRAQFLSHLDLMLLFARSARRAGLPIAYSEGFNPHPKLSLGRPILLVLLVWRNGRYGFNEIYLARSFYASP